MKLQHQALKTLQHRVVQFPRYSSALNNALFQANVELPRHLVQPQSIKRVEQCQKCSHAQQTEPVCLVPGRRDGERQGSTSFVPHATVIAGTHAEAVAARRQIAIERLPASVGVLPIAIPTFELVAKKYLFRHDEAERCIVDL